MSARSSLDYIPLTEALQQIKQLDLLSEYKTTAKLLAENKARVIIGNKRYLTRDSFDQILASVRESECKHRGSK